MWTLYSLKNTIFAVLLDILFSDSKSITPEYLLVCQWYLQSTLYTPCHLRKYFQKWANRNFHFAAGFSPASCFPNLLSVCQSAINAWSCFWNKSQPVGRRPESISLKLEEKIFPLGDMHLLAKGNLLIFLAVALLFFKISDSKIAYPLLKSRYNWLHIRRIFPLKFLRLCSFLHRKFAKFLPGCRLWSLTPGK